MHHKRNLKLAAFIVVGLLAILFGFVGVTQFHEGSPWQSILLNLATEFAGIVIIFVLFDRLFDLESEQPETPLLSGIHDKVESINTNLAEAVKKILAEVTLQQRSLSNNLQERFTKHTADGVQLIRQAISQDVTLLMLPGAQRDQLLSRLVDMVGNAINQMGEFQRLNLQQQSESVVTKIESRVNQSISGVAQEVNDLKRTIALPPPRPAESQPAKRIGRKQE